MQHCGHTYQYTQKEIQKPRLQHNAIPKYLTRLQMFGKVEKELIDSRGRELPPGYDHRLVAPIFREQSAPWIGIARAYSQAVWKKASEFLQTLLVEISEKEACKALLHYIIEPAMESRLRLLEGKLEELYKPYKSGLPYTLNSRFAREVEQRKQEYLETNAEGHGNEDIPSSTPLSSLS